MYRFHLKQYSHNSYFISLVVISTVSILFLKFIGSYSLRIQLTQNDVIIAGLFGMWSSAVTSAGILHFQRNQGVLVYLVNGSRQVSTNLIALISSASTFGLVAFPLAYIASGLLNMGNFPTISAIKLCYILLFWIGTLPITYTIAEIFLLTKNAFVYEGLFVTPILIFSGLFGNSTGVLGHIEWVSNVIPITFPIHLLVDNTRISFLSVIIWLIVLSLWLLLSWLALKKILFKVRVTSELEVS